MTPPPPEAQVRPSWWSHAEVAQGPHGRTALRELPDAAACAISRVDEVAGRYSTVRTGGRTARLLLAKNPAGWAATLAMIRRRRPLLIAVNAREADGRDTSWLWDVDFGTLVGRQVVASGERSADLGVRLSYAEIPHQTEPDPLVALRMLAPGEIDVVANYTAFHALRRRLTTSSPTT